MNDGDRVKALGDGTLGTIQSISASGKLAYVKWDDDEYPGWYDIEEELSLA